MTGVSKTTGSSGIEIGPQQAGYKQAGTTEPQDATKRKPPKKGGTPALERAPRPNTGNAVAGFRA